MIGHLWQLVLGTNRIESNLPPIRFDSKYSNRIKGQFDSIRFELRLNSIRFESNRGPIRFEVQFEPNFLKFNNSTKTYLNLMNFSLFDAPDDGESSTTKNIKFGHVSIELLHFEFEINISNRIRPQFDSIESNQASIRFELNSIRTQFEFKNPQFDSIRMTLNSIRFELIRFVWGH